MAAHSLLLGAIGPIACYQALIKILKEEAVDLKFQIEKLQRENEVFRGQLVVLPHVHEEITKLEKENAELRKDISERREKLRLMNEHRFRVSGKFTE